MGKREPLSREEIDRALRDLPGWSYEEDQLRKTFAFGSFREAVSFIVRMSFHAEELDHHPDLHNVYDRVHIALNTHDAGGKVTEMDLALARAIEEFAWT